MTSVSLAFCFNNSYCELASGAIASLIKHTTEKYQYDIYILHDDISVQNQHLINTLNQKDNVTIIFKVIEFDRFTTEDINYNWGTQYTFARLFLHKLFPDLSKLLFMDSDIIVTSDIAELFNQDLSGCAIGGCTDPYFTRDPETLKTVQPISGIKKIPNHEKYPSVYDYLRKYVNLNDDEMGSYFNAGILLLDLKKSGAALDRELPNLIKNKYIYADQDILNIIFKKDKIVLDQKFNVFADNLLEFITENSELPAIIHFINTKPIKSMRRPMSYYYWEEVSETHFYYQALEKFIDIKSSDLEGRIYRHFNDEKYLEDLFYNLKRMNRLRVKRKFIRLLIRPLVDSKKYKKLKKDPGRFFEDSKSAFIRFLGRYYI